MQAVLNEEQAKKRAGIGEGSHNHGVEWAQSAVQVSATKLQYVPAERVSVVFATQMALFRKHMIPKVAKSHRFGYTHDPAMPFKMGPYDDTSPHH